MPLWQPRCSRYDKLANEVLAESTIAGGSSSVQYLASCAALQQWEQAALGYLLLHAGRQLSVDALAERVESLLEGTFQARCTY